MRIFYFFLISILFQQTDIFAQKEFKPQKVTYYSWQNNGWELTNYRFIKYNHRGDITEEVVQNKNGEFLTKKTTKYTSNFLPEKIEEFKYDRNKNEWQPQKITGKSYHTSGKMQTEEVIFKNNNGLDSARERRNYTFNEHGVEIKYESYKENFISGNWKVISGFANLTTDSAGLKRVRIAKKFDTITNDFSILTQKNDEWFNEEGNPVKAEIYHWKLKNNNYNWQRVGWYAYKYRQSGSYYEYESQTADFILKFKNVAWANWEKRKMSSLESHSLRISDSLTEIYKYEYSYPDERTTIATSYAMIDGKWELVQRNKLVTSTNVLLPDERHSETWNGIDWETMEHEKYEYFYDRDSNIVEKIRLRWNKENKALDSIGRWLYGDFTEVVSKEKDNILNDIKIYPNPVQNVLVVNTNSSRSYQSNISITDLTGRNIFTKIQNLKQGENNIIIETYHLKPGIYILRIDKGVGSFYMQKIVKTE